MWHRPVKSVYNYILLFIAISMKHLEGNYVLHYVHHNPKAVSMGHTCVYTFIKSYRNEFAEAVKI